MQLHGSVQLQATSRLERPATVSCAFGSPPMAVSYCRAIERISPLGEHISFPSSQEQRNRRVLNETPLLCKQCPTRARGGHQLKCVAHGLTSEDFFRKVFHLDGEYHAGRHGLAVLFHNCAGVDLRSRSVKRRKQTLWQTRVQPASGVISDSSDSWRNEDDPRT